MKKKLTLEQVTLVTPEINEQEQRNTKGGGIWINGMYIGDDLLDLADQYAITPDEYDSIDWDALANGDYGGNGSDYGGGSGSGSGDSSDEFTREQEEDLVEGLNGAIAITGIASSISLAVDNLSFAQAKQISNFGKSLGIVGGLWSSVSLGISLVEEQHFDANDALAAASIALGVAALMFPPTAIILGTTAFVMSIAVNSDWGDDNVIYDWGDNDRY